MDLKSTRTVSPFQFPSRGQLASDIFCWLNKGFQWHFTREALSTEELKGLKTPWTPGEAQACLR